MSHFHKEAQARQGGRPGGKAAHPVALVCFDCTGQISTANPRALALFGLPADATVERFASCRIVADRAERALFLKTLEGASEGRLDAYPIVLRRADGLTTRCQVSVVAEYDRYGRVARYRAAIHEACRVHRAWEGASSLFAGAVDADGLGWQGLAVKHLARKLRLAWVGLIEIDAVGNAQSLALWADGRQQPRRTWHVKDTAWEVALAGESRFLAWPRPARAAEHALPGVGSPGDAQGGMVVFRRAGGGRVLLAAGGDAGPTGLAGLAEPLTLAGRMIEFRACSDPTAVADRRGCAEPESNLENSPPRLEAAAKRPCVDFEQPPVGMLICHQDIVPAQSANPRMEELLGYDVASLKALPWRRLVHPDDHGVYERLRARLLAAGRATGERPLRLRRQNGTWIWAELGATVLRDAAGCACGTSFSVADVDLALADQRRSERLGAIMSELRIGILILDAEGRLEHINRHALKACDPVCTRLLGTVVWDVEVPGYIGTALRLARNAVEAGVAFQGRIRQLGEGSEERIFKIRVAPVAPATRTGPTSSLITCRDITDQAQLEDQVQEAQKLEALGTLASGIAHDFNNVLAPIVGYADMGLDEVEPDTRIHQYLEHIARAGRQASKLVRQILTFGKTNSQDRHAISIGAMARETLDLLRHTVPTSIEMDCRVEEGLPCVLANETQIEQVFMNLCVNAAHAMKPQGGVLSVVVEALPAVGPFEDGGPESPPSSEIRILVSDDGCGMSASVREHVFEPFFTTKEATGGTGLGLSVVHRIITSHGGRIRVRSEPGRGTSFEVILPGVTAEAPRAEAAPRASVGGGERILVLDDEEVVAGVVRDALRGLGYDVVAMTNPRRALELLRRDPSRFDLVITDLTMPDLSGRELAKALVGLRPDLPVVLMTGDLSACHGEASELACVRATVAKPLNVRDIDQVVRLCLEGASHEKSQGGTSIR